MYNCTDQGCPIQEITKEVTNGKEEQERNKRDHEQEWDQDQANS